MFWIFVQLSKPDPKIIVKMFYVVASATSVNEYQLMFSILQ